MPSITSPLHVSRSVATSALASAQRIVALAFDCRAKAQEALRLALRFEEQRLLRVHDAAVVGRALDGTALERESSDPTAVAAAVPTSLVGALVGTLVAGPLGFLVGGVLGGSGGALAAKWIDAGIPDEVVSQLQQRAQPGQTVLALLVSGDAGTDAIDQLRRRTGGAPLA